MIRRVSAKPITSTRFRGAMVDDVFSVAFSFDIEAKGTKLSSEFLTAQTYRSGRFVSGPFSDREFWSIETLERWRVAMESFSAAAQAFINAQEIFQQSLKTNKELADQPRSSWPLTFADDVKRALLSYTDAKRRMEASLSELTEATAGLKAIEDEMATPELFAAFKNVAIPLRCEDSRDEVAYALYRGAVWSCQHQLTPEQWALLADRYVERENAELASALGDGVSSLTRERISTEVRRAVWMRDQGMCARCKSRERLEYDHIVPLARGGSNTERNIELLCEVCNRAKSDAIM